VKVEIRHATLRDLCYTAATAREIDKKELLHSGPRTLQQAGAMTFYLVHAVGGAAYCVTVDGNPEFVFGFARQSEYMPWLFSGWAWGSEKTNLCMPKIASWAHDHLLDVLDVLGAERIEARSIHDHHDAHRWLEWMGFKLETKLPGWGKDGELFYLFAWVKSEFDAGRLRGIARSAAVAKTHPPVG
jgi:hypothetical protein